MAISVRYFSFIIGASILGNVSLRSNECGEHELKTAEERMQWLICKADGEKDMATLILAKKALHEENLHKVAPNERPALEAMFELELQTLKAIAQHSQN
jgi:hypothetical protein